MDNGDISVEHSLAEQHPHVDNEQRESSTQNQSTLAKLVVDPNKMKKSPMTPTPLYIICFSVQAS